MQVTYDTHRDTLTIILRDELVSESDEERPGLILDYDAAGNVVSLEILDASKRVTQPMEMLFKLAG